MVHRVPTACGESILSSLLLLRCKAAVEPTVKPIWIGYEISTVMILRQEDSEGDIQMAQRAWTTLCDAVTSPALVNKVCAKGSQ